MTKAKVVRGTGGRFERVVDAEVAQVAADTSPKAKEQRSGAVVSANTVVTSQGDSVINASSSLFNTLVTFSRVLFVAGMIRSDALFERFGNNGPDEDTDIESDPQPYASNSIEGMVGMFNNVMSEHYTVREAGTVFGAAYYHARPVMQLAMYLLTLAAGDTEENAYGAAVPPTADRLTPMSDINPISVNSALCNTYIELFEKHKSVSQHLFGDQEFDDAHDIGKETSIVDANSNVLSILDATNRLFTQAFLYQFERQFGIVLNVE